MNLDFCSVCHCIQATWFILMSTMWSIREKYHSPNGGRIISWRLAVGLKTTKMCIEFNFDRSTQWYIQEFLLIPYWIESNRIESIRIFIHLRPFRVNYSAKQFWKESQTADKFTLSNYRTGYKLWFYVSINALEQSWTQESIHFIRMIPSTESNNKKYTFGVWSWLAAFVPSYDNQCHI